MKGKIRSMYKGKQKFTREQLIFVVNVMLCASLDQVESSLPPNFNGDELPKGYLDSLKQIASEIVGWNLSILYAQLTGDGMGNCDAMATIQYDAFIDSFVNRRRSNPKAKTPDCRKLAEKFVNEVFKDYVSNEVIIP